MLKIKPVGATYVHTQSGEALDTRQLVDGKVMLSNSEKVQVKRAFVTASTNATTELLAAVADKAFRVLSVAFIGGGTAPTVTFKSASTAISPAFTLAANGGAVLPPNVWGWFQTNAINEALNVTVSSSSDVGVIINFIEVPQDCFDIL